MSAHQPTHHPDQPRPDMPCVDCGGDIGHDPVQAMDPADDPSAALGWLCLGCFDLTLLLEGVHCPDDLGGMPW